MKIGRWFQLRWNGFWTLFFKEDAAENPETHYIALAEDYRERAQKHTVALGALKGQLNIQQTKLEAAQKAHTFATKKLQQALGRGENGKEAGLRALADKKSSESLVASLTEIVKRLRDEYEAGVLQGRKLRSDYEARIAKSQINVTRLRAHEAAAAALSQFDSMSVDDLARDYATVDEAIEERIGGYEAEREIVGASVDALKADAAAEAALDEDEWSRMLTEQQQREGVSTAATPSGDGGKTA